MYSVAHDCYHKQLDVTEILDERMIIREREESGCFVRELGSNVFYEEQCKSLLLACYRS